VKYWRALASVVLGFCLSLGPERVADAGDGFVIVVHGSNPVSSISGSELRRAVLGGMKQWGNGAIVQLGIIPKDVPETRYLASVLGLSVSDLFARIQAQVFNGEMRRPVVLRSSADCVAFARASDGAVCVAEDRPPFPPEVKLVSIH
jgi:hypothetical protein